MKSDDSKGWQGATYSQKIIVNPEDIDDLNHVNNVVYLKWVQAVAAAHWQLLPSAVTAHHLWVALRHEIDYLHPAFLGNEIIATTWVESMEGVKSIRHVEFYLNEKCLAKAKTTWCLLDAATLKPKRISPEIKTWFDANK